MFDGTGTLNSPPRVAGKKRQLAASPSPPPHAPQPFEIPSKSPASFYDSRSAFDMARSLSTPSSTTRNTSSSSDYHMSPTPLTSLPNSAGSSKKKAKSDIMQQVDLVRDGIESLQSNAASRHETKHQRFLAKLDAKSEHQRDSKRYEWLRDTRETRGHSSGSCPSAPTGGQRCRDSPSRGGYTGA
ncbi:hypothetical protein EDD22DRAFT_948882 [Suillus occidentalis]|nr:hypothetical protein EDD22DRAFT_948882 [Suillus occidentalis]